MRQPGSAFRTAATCSFSNAASASPLPFAARIFATTVSTSAIVVSSPAGVPASPLAYAPACLRCRCSVRCPGESVLPPSCRMRVMPRDPRPLDVVTDVPERAMVVFAHPDDAEIGSGGVIARWIEAGCEVTYVLCTNGDAGTAERSRTPEALAARRADEQRAAADFMRVKHVVMLGYLDGFLEDTREFLGDVVRALRQYRPHTVFVHDPYRIRNFQHRDHRKAGLTTTDAIYPYARDHLHFPTQITQEGLAPHKVRELWYWGADEPNDITDSIDRQIAALVRHESQMPGFNVAAGETIGGRIKKGAAAVADGYGFRY